MPKVAKITREDVINGRENGLSIQEMSYEYDVAPYTVLLLVKKIEREENEQGQAVKPFLGRFENDCGAYITPIEFDLEVGDIVEALDSETSAIKRKYCVTRISTHVYECERLSEPKYRTSFRIDDYKRIHDPGKVKLIAKGASNGRKKN